MATNALDQVPLVSMRDQASDPEGFAQGLGDSFKRFGFAMVSDHGVPQDLIERACAKTKEFFDLPEEEGGPLTYVVSSINVKYHRQATVGDILIGHSMVRRVRAAAIEVKQWITRDGEMVAEAELVVAVIGNDGRPKRWPNSARICWQNMMDEAMAAGKNT